MVSSWSAIHSKPLYPIVFVKLGRGLKKTCIELLPKNKVIIYFNSHLYMLWITFSSRLGWGGYVDVHINQWERVVTNWIRGLRRGGVICYEHMEEDFERELLHLASILGFQSVDKSRLDCVVEFQRQFLAASNNLKYPRWITLIIHFIYWLTILQLCLAYFTWVIILLSICAIFF